MVLRVVTERPIPPVQGTGRFWWAGLSYLWYEFCFWLSFVGMTLLFSLRMEGRRRLPRRGPVLIIANHQSFLDPVLVGLAAPRHLCYLARKTLFKNPLFAILIRSLHAVPIDQEGVSKEGLKTIVRLLEQGEAVVVFPEGTRTPNGELQPLKPGIHLLIRRSRAAIVPVGIAGAFHALPYWEKVPRLAPLLMAATRSTLAVSVGKPLDAGRLAELPREQLLEELLDELRQVQERAERLRRKR
jgi:1-acyl-sn-glycerol-3-phosphate acyltransferase